MVSDQWWNRLTFCTRKFWTILLQFSKTLKTLRCSGLSNRRQEVRNLCWILWCNSLAFVWETRREIDSTGVSLNTLHFSGFCLRNRTIYFIWSEFHIQIVVLLSTWDRSTTLEQIFTLWIQIYNWTDLQVGYSSYTFTGILWINSHLHHVASIWSFYNSNMVDFDALLQHVEIGGKSRLEQSFATKSKTTQAKPSFSDLVTARPGQVARS